MECQKKTFDFAKMTEVDLFCLDQKLGFNKATVS